MARYALLVPALLAGVGGLLGAQRSLNPKPPSSRTPSTLSSADSIALAVATARWIVSRFDTTDAPCVTSMAQTIPGAVGEAFDREVRALAAAIPPRRRDREVSNASTGLIAFVDGDTVGVVVSVFSGNATHFSEAQGTYYFTRTPAQGEWRFVFRILGGYGDYVVDPDQPARPPLRCLNAQHR